MCRRLVEAALKAPEGDPGSLGVVDHFLLKVLGPLLDEKRVEQDSKLTAVFGEESRVPGFLDVGVQELVSDAGRPGETPGFQESGLVLVDGGRDQGDPRGELKRGEHGDDISERRTLQPSLTDRQQRVPGKVVDEHVSLRDDQLTEVIIAVTARPEGVDLLVENRPEPGKDLALPVKHGLREFPG